MNRNQIMTVIEGLSKAQGSYSRMYAALLEMQENEPDEYDRVMQALEEERFEDSVDLILFLEG